MKHLLVSALGAALLSLTAPAQANLAYSFDSDAQGWTVFDGGDMVYQASGGNSGGFLQITDSSFGDFRLLLPAAALGNWSVYLGGTLSFDARNISSSAADYAGFGEITLGGGNLSLTADAAGLQQPPADGQWHSYSLVLDAATFGPLLPLALANLGELTIKPEYHDSSDSVFEVVGVDNIHISSAVPELGKWVLMLAGVLAVGKLHRRRVG